MPANGKGRKCFLLTGQNLGLAQGGTCKKHEPTLRHHQCFSLGPKRSRQRSKMLLLQLQAKGEKTVWRNGREGSWVANKCLLALAGASWLLQLGATLLRGGLHFTLHCGFLHPQNYIVLNCLPLSKAGCRLAKREEMGAGRQMRVEEIKVPLWL